MSDQLAILLHAIIQLIVEKSHIRHLFIAFLFLFIGYPSFSYAGVSTSQETEPSMPVQLSQDFLYAVRTQHDVQEHIDQLAILTENQLDESLTSDNQKTAFWLNIYNGFVQHLLTGNTELYQDRSSFFKDKHFTVAGKQLSLDDVEHGMLRNSTIKISMGYFKNPFPSNFEKKYRVSTIDWRIHFALNCGAKSCPPIAFYSPDQIDNQLQLATKNYLSQEVEYKKEMNEVCVPKLMSWFRGDFGGKSGIRSILREYEFIPQNSKPSIQFKDYNWDLELKKYQ